MKHSYHTLLMVLATLYIMKAYPAEISVLEETRQAQSLTIFSPTVCDQPSIRDDVVHVNFEFYLPITDDVNLIDDFNSIDFSEALPHQLITKITEEHSEREQIYSFNNVRLKKMQSSSDFGVPFTFTLGEGKAIKGFEQGLYNMCIGEQRVLIIPPELAYGASGISGFIPPESTVIFHVHLVKIERRVPKQLRLD
ncbi:FKBP-type peptidyl-prolyl cis-trans isomerase [Endozoicomonas numazuensis]|uniref:FKBP-type peptidyl-prolyl cis-trans isomerase n=1 Tax=Endozoicomonas numazuensis TaxID=1137799 RepID=UPI001F173C3C|nr:FKBP-type peptidyl-prolyl cis-trans isomerase [Endozoicomonas numazuensis]